ncbi:Acetyltransferase (GNAT) domain-containing protein [Noviherbaspirillum humi]|uniref:Acetyltransferase (GNAT) domain-containing protein n=1 Tax=Noviherbaspirillum humi TaxID=1688639 RepID=A0A239FT09_9BURK|nr:GNAT family N-acetyltransferase [Noviherbaspirillum humi]SNS59970.1 Acetyltransferase (GNAT) domain-containing protein [Noviherbaspirillum humi]
MAYCFQDDDSNVQHASTDEHQQRDEMSSAKESYRDLWLTEPSIPIFCRDWWLDATAGSGNWDVVLVKKGNRILAAMPYMIRRRFGMTVLTQPPLTPTLGPWLQPPDASLSPAERVAQENHLMQSLIDQLPAFDAFSQNWHYRHTNWLPFYWNGFRQTTRYTLVTDLRQPDKLWVNLQKNVHKHCKTASERYRVTIRDDLPLDDFLALNRMTFQRQGLTVPYSDAYVRSLDAACAKRGCRRYYIAVDPEGRHHAGCYFVWDENSAYGLMNGSDPALRHSGALSLCFWHALRDAAQVANQFDFEGSMIEPIERFLRYFGTVQKPYFYISKTPSRLLRLREGLLSVVGRAR